MNPVSPVITVIPGAKYAEVVYAKDQPQYRPMPAVRNNDGLILSRWHMSFWERVRVLLHGDVYLRVMTFNQPLQPVSLDVEPPVER